MAHSTDAFTSATRFFTVSTAGHVDHGKTSLLKALTGIDPDRLKEEKERQMTTDLGFAYLQVDDQAAIGFIDVPGHGKFLKNMLAGVGGIDLALLVVAADEGPMPQTRQHVRILSLLGVKNAVVALSKMDMVADSEHLDAIAHRTEQLLKDHGMNMIELVPVSSTKMQGTADLLRALTAAVFALPERDYSGSAFLPVDRVFSKAGFGTVITGTLVRGKLSVGDQIMIGPDLIEGRVRRLETFGCSVDFAKPGQRVACNIVLKESGVITRGHVVLGSRLAATTTILVSLFDQPSLLADRFIERVSGQPVRLYHGTAECQGYIRWAQPADAGNSIDQVKQAESQAGVVSIALITLEQPLVAQSGDRFVIRLGDETVLGGQVILLDRPRWCKRADLLAICNLMSVQDYGSALCLFVAAAPQQMASRAQINLLLSPPLDELTIAALLQQNRLVALGEKLMSPAVRQALSNGLQNCIKRALQVRATQVLDGVSLEVVRSNFQPKIDRATFNSLVEAERKNGLVIRNGDQLGIAGTIADRNVDSTGGKLYQDIVRILQESFCLELKEIAHACNVDLAGVTNAVRVLARSGQIHLINYDFAISDENLQLAHRVLVDVWQRKHDIAPGEYRQDLGTTRKYAMALLQHFDDNKITRRVSSGRVLLKPPLAE